MKKLVERTGITEEWARISFPPQGSNRGFDPIQLINNFWVSIWSGASRHEHLEVTRQNPVIQKMFGWKRMAGHKAFQRYIKKFSQATNQRAITALFQWFFKQIHFDNYTLDVDSTIFTRYGTQEGATKGYNPNKRGRNSHHPLVAFVAEVRMAVNFWLRSGSRYTANIFWVLSKTRLKDWKARRSGC